MTSSKKGFTLVELIIVMIILGILTASIIPRVFGALERARNVSRISGISQIAQGLDLYFTDNGSYPIANSGSLSPVVYNTTPFGINTVLADDQGGHEACEQVARDAEQYLQDNGYLQKKQEYDRFCTAFGYQEEYEIENLILSNNPTANIIAFVEDCEQGMLDKHAYLVSPAGQDYLNNTLKPLIENEIATSALPEMSSCVAGQDFDSCKERYYNDLRNFIYYETETPGNSTVNTRLAIGGAQCAQDFLDAFQANPSAVDPAALATQCIEHLSNTPSFMFTDYMPLVNYVVNNALPGADSCAKSYLQSRNVVNKNILESALVGPYLSSLPRDPLDSKVTYGIGMCDTYSRQFMNNNEVWAGADNCTDVQTEKGYYAYSNLVKNGEFNRGFVLMAAMEGETIQSNRVFNPWALDNIARGSTIYPYHTQEEISSSTCNSVVSSTVTKNLNRICYIDKGSDDGRYIQTSSQ